MSGRPLPVLMFHHVEPVAAAELAPPPLHPMSYLSRQQLAAVLDLLAERGSTTLTLAEATARRRAGRPLPRRPVVLTFDDGCRCFRDHAVPELAARGMTATLFAVSGELGGSNSWDRPLGAPARGTPDAAGRPGSPEEAGEEGAGAEPGAPRRERREDLLDAAALRELAARGFEVGSHGRRHRDLTACGAAELAAEVAGSREDLEAALGRPVVTFCYPYGSFDAAARDAVVRAGYAAAVAIHGVSGAATAAAGGREGRDGASGGSGGAGDPFALRRFPVIPGDSRFELRLKASGAYFWWSRLPRLGLLRALRRRRGAPASPAQAGSGDGR